MDKEIIDLIRFIVSIVLGGGGAFLVFFFFYKLYGKRLSKIEIQVFNHIPSDIKALQQQINDNQKETNRRLDHNQKETNRRLDHNQKETNHPFGRYKCRNERKPKRNE